MLKAVTKLHARMILRRVQMELLKNGQASIFSDPADVELVDDVEMDCPVLRIRLCEANIMMLFIDPRTGRVVMKDVGVYAASNRSGRFLGFSNWVNRQPSQLAVVVRQVRFEV